ncbi:hypothetical protein PTKIN_Ptkin07bG0105900 [Pterospermum kingtungense]
MIGLQVIFRENRDKRWESVWKANFAPKDVPHVLFTYPLSAAAWVEIGVDVNQLDVNNLNWNEVLDFWKATCGIKMAMYLGWSLWSNRNNCLHKHVCKSATTLVVKSKRHLQEFMEANSKLEPVA